MQTISLAANLAPPERTNIAPFTVEAKPIEPGSIYKTHAIKWHGITLREQITVPAFVECITAAAIAKVERKITVDQYRELVRELRGMCSSHTMAKECRAHIYRSRDVSTRVPIGIARVHCPGCQKRKFESDFYYIGQGKKRAAICKECEQRGVSPHRAIKLDAANQKKG